MSRDFALEKYMSQIMNALLKEVAFSGLSIRSRFEEFSQSSGEDWEDLRELKDIHQHIIEIRPDLLSDVLTENTINPALERHGGIP